MDSQFQAVVGSEIAVSAAAPATHDASGFGALTFTDIDTVGQLGEIGPTDGLVTFTPVNDGITQKAQGNRNYGSQALQMAYTTTTDPGVAILETAHAARASVSVKETLPDGAIRYYQAKCMGVREVRGAAETVLGLATTLEITTSIVKVDAPS